jgi:hypothetical protein
MASHENEAHEIAERVGRRQNIGRHAAFGTTNSLAQSPPFAPCPVASTMVASTTAYSIEKRLNQNPINSGAGEG